MKKSDLQEIGSLIEEKLEPIKETLEKHGRMLEQHDNQFKSISAKLDEHTEKLDSLMLDMVDVQKKTDVLPDYHSMIKDTREEIKDHEQRIEALENVA